MCGTLVRICLIGVDETALGDGDARLFGADLPCRSARGRPRRGSCRRSGASLPSNEARRPFGVASTLVVLGVEHHLVERFGVEFLPHRDEIAIGAEHSGHPSSRRRRGACERRVHRAHLQADDCRRDDEASSFGTLGSSSARVESRMRGSSRQLISPEPQLRRLRAHRDMRVREAQRALVALSPRWKARAGR